MKKYITIGAAILMFFTAIVPASAAFEAELVLPAQLEESGEISPLNQDTIWFSRTNNGIKEKRLWSITDRCWLTDWIPVNP